jgi:hypothetical protein
MADCNPTIKRYTAENSELSASAFVALVVPCDANSYLIKNAGPDVCYMRSDSVDADTEDELGPGAMESLFGGHGTPWGRTAKFQAGETLYFVKCSGPLIGKFWR